MIEKIAERMINGKDTHWEMDLEHFDWGPGVGLSGIWRAYEVTGNTAYLDALEGWAGRHLKEAEQVPTVNSAAPCLTLWELYRATGKEEYRKVCLDMAQYLMTQAPRTVDGGLEHTVTEDVPDMKEQMWADTLFMACIFLARIGRDEKRPEPGSFAARQLVLHYQYLWDEEKELFFHGWNGLERGHMSGVRWGRANAWILISTLEILEAQPDFPGRDQVVDTMKCHMKALCRVQRENGMFGTILDDDTSYDEISASAGIAAGLSKAVRLGYGKEAEQAAARRVQKALPGYVAEDGSVMGVSTGTPIMPDAQAYRTIGRGSALYGQALAIMAFAEGMA